MRANFALSALLVASFPSLALCVNPLVNLTYSQYIGQPLANGITQWLGIRYAAPPLGDLRFAPPQDPPFSATPLVAKKQGKFCLKTNGNPYTTATSEDCLFLDVYAPSNATAQSKLPVFVFIQGGGFNSNSDPNINGTGLIMASNNSIIFVTFNYRVGPYGFLTDGKNTTANNGLRDQRKVLEWVQKHIAKFGGDPDHVVIGGASAGAASISLHMVANGGIDRGLFHAAAAESVAFPTILTVSESQYQYDNLAIRMGCAGNNTLSCLRSKTSLQIQKQNTNVPYPGSSNAPLYMWGPVIDNDFLVELPHVSFLDGSFIKVPAIFGDDTNGGTIFAPDGTSTKGESNQFIKDQFPYITVEQLGKLNELYPNPAQDLCPKSGCWWRQLSNVYGEMRYMCPGFLVNTEMVRNGVNASYSYRWNVEDAQQMADGLGVPHTAEVDALFGPYNTRGPAPASYFPGGINAHAVLVIQGYWVSFIKTFDPNAYRCCGSAEWKPWTEKLNHRLLFDTGGKTSMESLDAGLKERCQYVDSIAVSLHQ
ncbi:Alpha/Beta hydrolase protein [Lasiosphaeris hirsuta]|uniref:Carboxylic ester hydrolase n=1 Tax=Lasiosphaeris hirsuta TaxID=260670 RepID=A0AA40BB88_9PEZI|nr:Alpha/Beta hydrolase protein [Lasiosphaeris hirsuta]